ncbi:MAG: BlaR1 family beta-lactam sensor/signal transducer [Clostridia bacterium]|nr:BlaR1 family beta-lactam sensor/signal transducer [Clostridia bacterium]
MFIYHFLISNFFISSAILIIFLVKAFMGKRLSARCNYFMWFFIMILMIAAFVPGTGIPQFINQGIKEAVFKSELSSDINFGSNIKDLYISVNSYSFLYVIWISGLIINLLFLFSGRIKLNRIIKHKETNLLFEDCCKRVGVKADLYISPSVSSPMSFGIIKPLVVIPEIKLSYVQLRHIILHELIHHKHKDIYINYIFCFLGAVYWFNPFVYIMLDRIRLDMEIYCDYSVIEYTRNSIDYGNTILSMAEHKSGLKAANYLSDNKKNLKSRIIRIADFNKKSSIAAGKTVFAFLAAVTLTFSFIINSYGYDMGNSSFAVDGDYIDLKEHFKDYEGCFVLYDTNNDRYTVYNKAMAEKRVSPDSTYKIALALNGLEAGVITAENNEINWDGKENPFDDWNKNHNLDSAMKYSVNWYFQDIDSRLSKSEISDYLKQISYGNMLAGYDSENYWLENSLKISAAEQVDFLKKVYNNDFGFESINVNAVLNSIKLSDNFYGKTGTGMVNGKTVNGWFVGIIDKEDNTYIFSVRIAAKDNATGLAAKKITEDILEDILMIN